MIRYFLWALALTVVFLTVGVSGLHAEERIDQTSQVIEKSCLPDLWNTPECLGIMAQTNKAMVAQYMTQLKNTGHENQIENVKQECAASTAVDTQPLQDSVLIEVYTVCMNAIYGAMQKTGILPAMSANYQLMTMANLCLRKDPRCQDMIR